MDEKSTYDSQYAEIYRSADGWRFRIKGGNNEIIVAGESYGSKQNAIAGAERVHPGIQLKYPQQGLDDLISADQGEDPQ